MVLAKVRVARREKRQRYGVWALGAAVGILVGLAAVALLVLYRSV